MKLKTSLFSKLSISLFLLSVSFQANSAILIEEKGQPVARNRYKITTNSQEFREQRKVGIGVGLAGNHGLVGMQLELNFTPEVSFLAGYGVSRGFQSASFQFRRGFPGGSFLPYVAAGYSRWFRGGGKGSLKESSPSFFSDKFLSGKERAEGEFAENILLGTAGLQYLQYNGNWAGTAFYAEILFLVDIDDFVAAPTGGVGMMYYF